jgi:hypothetical protein
MRGFDGNSQGGQALMELPVTVQKQQGPASSASLDTEVRSRLAEAEITSEGKSTVSECLRDLKKRLSRLGPDWQVRPFGSFANGLCTRDSDLDATCFRQDLDADQYKNANEELKLRLLPLLRSHPRFEVVEEIWAARVPILKLRFDQVLEVDLSCHNTEPLPNTQLLRAYVELHPIVRDLVVAIKLWAKTANVCGAKYGHLSSYSLTLMTLYFLQVDPIAQMPCLPTWAFTGSRGTPAAAQMKWSFSQSLSSLLHRFFCFYAYEFDWGTEVVSVRVGRRSGKSDTEHGEMRGLWVARLHVADPFLKERNLNCVLGQQQEQGLYARICEAAMALQNSTVPVGLGSPNADGGQTKPATPTTAGQGQLAVWNGPGGGDREDDVSTTVISGFDIDSSGGTATGKLNNGPIATGKISLNGHTGGQGAGGPGPGLAQGHGSSSQLSGQGQGASAWPPTGGSADQLLLAGAGTSGRDAPSIAVGPPRRRNEEVAMAAAEAKQQQRSHPSNLAPPGRQLQQQQSFGGQQLAELGGPPGGPPPFGPPGLPGQGRSPGFGAGFPPSGFAPPPTLVGGGFGPPPTGMMPAFAAPPRHANALGSGGPPAAGDLPRTSWGQLQPAPELSQTRNYPRHPVAPEPECVPITLLEKAWSL